MTRYVAYLVTLEDSEKDEVAKEGVLNALRMLKGIASVDPIEDSLDLQLAKKQARNDLVKELWEVLTK